MARTRSSETTETAAYRHTDQKRKNISPAKIAAAGEIPEVKARGMPQK